MSTMAWRITGATCSMPTGTRFCGPCSTARTLPSAARIRLSTPSTGSGRPVGSASKWSATLLVASPVPSTSGTARVATSSPAAVSSASSRASPGSRSRLLSRLSLTELVLPAWSTPPGCDSPLPLHAAITTIPTLLFGCAGSAAASLSPHDRREVGAPGYDCDRLSAPDRSAIAADAALPAPGLAGVAGTGRRRQRHAACAGQRLTPDTCCFHQPNQPSGAPAGKVATSQRAHRGDICYPAA